VRIDRRGWIYTDQDADAIRHLKSPNYNQRPDPEDVSLIVIHNISLPPGQFGTGCIESFFCNHLDTRQHPFFAQICELQVSAHFLIDRNGRITQFVSVFDRAWHAGESVFSGRANCNDYSIGIELEGTDELEYSDAQYQVLVPLIKTLIERFPKITYDRICGHCDIAPGRKTDPGPAFDWSRVMTRLAEADRFEDNAK